LLKEIFEILQVGLKWVKTIFCHPFLEMFVLALDYYAVVVVVAVLHYIDVVVVALVALQREVMVLQ
jgi:hypothetical protein